MELYDAVAIVTGGGSGIGRATARLLADRRARVVVAGRSSEALEATVELIRCDGGQGMAVATDVRDCSSVFGMVHAALTQFGRIDVLVNGAGVAVARPVEDTTEEEWDMVLDTNLKGIFLCCRAVLPSMIALGRGIIINVSSILGRRGLANYGAYCASKFGVIGLTEAIAAEHRGSGIRIFSVCPGPTFTELHRRLVGELNAQRSMLPEHVAERIVGLVTEEPPEEESGMAFVVDEQGHGTQGPEAKRTWRRGVARLVQPIVAAIRPARSRRR